MIIICSRLSLVPHHVQCMAVSHDNHSSEVIRQRALHPLQCGRPIPGRVYSPSDQLAELVVFVTAESLSVFAQT